jgi:PIN domain nuclease of toxin-antitoxin system
MGRRGVLLEKAPWEVWLEQLENHPLLAVLPLTARIAAESVRLGEDFPKDPADQIIVATARCHSLRLVTADQRIRRWGKVPLV